ncbi:CPBP family intramembrane metalloprotease [Candidatus Woesearchaeota archaeon]|nr:CPBP family intramembrane metalloprotease [Candidatus Woesearchaeota archaeon]
MTPILQLVLVISGISVWIFGKYLFENILLKKSRHSLNLFYSNIFNFKYNEYYSQLLLPIVISILIYYLLVFIYKEPLGISRVVRDWNIFWIIFLGGFIQPIFEEIVYRSIIFGFFLTLVDIKFKKSKFYWTGIIILFFIQAYTFMYLHDYKLFDFPRLLGGLYFGLLYLVNKRNIFPSIIAHISGNLTVILFWYFYWIKF